jgi:hypothetical protein
MFLKYKTKHKIRKKLSQWTHETSNEIILFKMTPCVLNWSMIKATC